MMTFQNAAGTTTTVEGPDFVSILRAHNLDSDERSRLTSVCLVCQSITVAPDVLSKVNIQRDFALGCCDAEATLLPA
jgi:hypothetical protein